MLKAAFGAGRETPLYFLKTLWYNTCNIKSIILAILKCPVSGIRHIRIIVQPSPPPSPELFHLPKLTLHTH